MDSIKRTIEEGGLNAYSGVVTDAQMKKAELELAQDGIYFWHYLFAYFGLDLNERPNEKDQRTEDQPNSSQPSTTTDRTQNQGIPIQPSVEDHLRLFRILKMNFSSHTEIKSIFSINKERKRLGERVNEVMKNKNKNKEAFENFCDEIVEYLGSMKDNILQVDSACELTTDNKRKLKEIKDMYDKNPKEIPKSNKELKSLIDDYIDWSWTLMCRILVSTVEKGLLESIRVNITFLKELFGDNSFLEKEKIDEKNLEYLVKKYSQLTPTLRPQTGVNNRKVDKSNIVTANLYIKYKRHGENSYQYQYTEINHHDKSAFSRASFLDTQKDEFDDHIRQHYEKTGKHCDLATCPERAVHDSEKALMMSLFGYNLTDEKKKDDSLCEERKEGDQAKGSGKIERIKNIVEGLRGKLEKDGIEKEHLLIIQEIGLQFFSIREYCYWCESYLSHEFKEVYDGIKKHLHDFYPNISIAPEAPENSILIKYGSYSFVIKNEQIASNENKKGKFVIDRTNMKSYFSKQFLIDVLKSNGTALERSRSYFLNDPKNWDPEKAVAYIKEVSVIADKLNKKPKNIKPKTEPITYMEK